MPHPLAVVQRTSGVREPTAGFEYLIGVWQWQLCWRRWTLRFFLGKVGKPDAASGHEGLVILERPLHLGIAGNAEAADRLKSDDRPGIAQRFVMAKWIGKERFAEWVDGERGYHRASDRVINNKGPGDGPEASAGTTKA